MNIEISEKARVRLPGFFDAAIPPDGGTPVVHLLVAGKWRPASTGEEFDVRSPIDGSVVARAARGSVDDVEEAIAAARESRAAFRSLPAAERLAMCAHAAGILAEHHDAFVAAIVADLGKTPEQAASEVKATRERLGLVREEVRKIFRRVPPGRLDRRDGGQVGGRAARAGRHRGRLRPVQLPALPGRLQGHPALAAGNTVVAKAPSDAPIPLVMFARVLEEAGLPPGVLNVITGRGGEIGDRLASHPGVSMISFTGSSAVGRDIAARAGPKPMHLELGGNGAAVVLADADLDLAVEKSVLGAYKNAGQRCDAVSRVLVERPLYDEYVRRAVEEAARWPVGDPRADGTQVGPLVNAAAAERVHGLVEDAVSKGARMLLGGSSQEAYHEPTVLADVPLDADVFWEETFGPVLTVTPVAGLGEALELANRSRYGLDSAVFTSDLENAWQAARALEVGQVTINDAPAHGVGHFPFGGRKPDSGIGREGLGYSIDECTVLKTVVLPT